MVSNVRLAKRMFTVRCRSATAESHFCTTAQIVTQTCPNCNSSTVKKLIFLAFHREQQAANLVRSYFYFLAHFTKFVNFVTYCWQKKLCCSTFTVWVDGRSLDSSRMFFDSFRSIIRSSTLPQNSYLPPEILFMSMYPACGYFEGVGWHVWLAKKDFFKLNFSKKSIRKFK
jgi:hypothetical protein